MSEEKEIQVLHIYGPQYYHEPTYIVGNTKALEELKYAIDSALATKDNVGYSKPFHADGEGYHAIVICNDSDWQAESWQQLKLPYTHENLVYSDKVTRPDDLIPLETFRSIVKDCG